MKQDAHNRAYTAEQHAEAAAWVKDRLAHFVARETPAFYDEDGGPVYTPLLVPEVKPLLRYLLGRLEAHPWNATGQCGKWDGLVSSCGRRPWPCPEAIAALDTVAEMRG